ncbi:hypothetical protein CC86DRAFT_373346 [Ophiobolus disseminans]|uniref:Uncharacterized protein n=1 Tax=Ophiobolus disseminans TaxID=1469910 RepID=A0A6A6ZPF0_9PLEO|nr:hypothetical protein CC86DRAFT_373346 [Ophiobolus disseminans]
MPSDSSDNSPQDLKYPPVQVNHSLSKLDLDTLIMRSTSRRLPEEADSVLEDSTFEFLGDSMLETSDDEAHTESIASTEGCTPDDASNFSDDDVDYPNDNRDLHQSISSFHAEASEQHHDSRSIHSTGDSTLTEVPAYMGYHGDPHTKQLNEQPGDEPGIIHGSRIDRSFPDEDGVFFTVLSDYGCPQVRLIIKAALSPESIPTPDSYRILYIGSLSSGEEEAVSSKICAALTACQSTSRSIMVQGRLQPYSPVMHAYHASHIDTSSKDGEPARIAITLQDGKQLTFGSGRSSTSEPQPDLVVFCHQSNPRWIDDAQKLISARKALDREKVPYLDMTSARQYHYGFPSYNSKSLSVCIEGRHSSEDEFELQEVLPIDYYTFSCLEPSQVNRHLALISPHMVSVAEKRPRISVVSDWWKAYVKTLRAARPGPLKTLILLMVLTAMVSTYMFGPVVMPMLSERLSNIETIPVASAPTPECRTSRILIAPEITSISLLASPGTQSASRDLSLVPPPAKAQKTEKKKVEKMVPFAIQPTTDQQFTLIPHKDILNARKKPQLQIQVSRGAQDIPIRFNRTISGVYVVDLEQQEPFGMFSVSIASYSKPLLQQSFEIGLGHNKSSLALFFDTAMRNIVETQDSILNISLIAATNVEAAARHWKDIHIESGQEVVNHLRTAKGVLGRMLRVEKELVKEVPGAAWTGMQKVTAPIRTSSPVLKARTRALRMRCKLEIAAGLSSADGDGKESWACSKVQGRS